MLYFSVDDKLCNRCRQCVLDCPSSIIEQDGQSVPKINRKNSMLFGIPAVRYARTVQRDDAAVIRRVAIS